MLRLFSMIDTPPHKITISKDWFNIQQKIQIAPCKYCNHDPCQCDYGVPDEPDYNDIIYEEQAFEESIGDGRRR